MQDLIGKNVLIFDTETSDLPITFGYKKYYHYSFNSKYIGRIIEISWCLVENFNIENLKNAEIFSYKCKPINCYHVNKKAYDVHNISFSDIYLNGTHFDNIIAKQGFGYHLLKCDYIVSHNTSFDINILKNELYRINYKKCISKIEELENENRVFCTLEMSTQMCQLFKTVNDQKIIKPPRLSELYKFFYNCEPPYELHKSSEDVKVLIDCLIKWINF